MRILFCCSGERVKLGKLDLFCRNLQCCYDVIAIIIAIAIVIVVVIIVIIITIAVINCVILISMCHHHHHYRHLRPFAVSAARDERATQPCIGV
jgi:Flp pilus assembly protein TadB